MEGGRGGGRGACDHICVYVCIYLLTFLLMQLFLDVYTHRSLCVPGRPMTAEELSLLAASLRRSRGSGLLGPLGLELVPCTCIIMLYCLMYSAESTHA